MRRTSRFLPLVLVVCVLPLLLGPAATPGCGCSKPSAPKPPPDNENVTKETYEKIKTGMTYSEVKELFGADGTFTPWDMRGSKGMKWSKGAAWIAVALDADDKVRDKRGEGLE